MDAERKTILIADDAEINRELLKMIFERQFDVLEAENGAQTIEILDEKHDEISMLFLDLIMPEKTGLEVMEHMIDKDYMNTIPVIMITGESTAETDMKAYEYGASDIIYKPFAAKVILRRAMNIMELFENRIHMEKKLEKRTKQLIESREKLEKNNEFLINALSSVVEFRSLESGEHIKRVKFFTRIFLNCLKKYYPEYELTKDKIDLIVNASALHDIGKIAIPDSILLKPGKLTKEEFEEMKKHTVYGCDILENFRQEDSEFYKYCYDICRYHHERYDGNGYPDKLVGEDIPIWAQVVSIVDVYDALVSKRVYKTPYAADVAVRMIHDGECGVFSPKILDCFDIVRDVLFESSEAFSYADANTGENSIVLPDSK
ncbi:MAG: response regulator [Clostridium sp.]|nr:response regulator [Clostridium sp.]MCM1399781.1 response regulator [Clostridium sp.]MCM1459592.1 response regulator [Bacteroides sp.]